MFAKETSAGGAVPARRRDPEARRQAIIAAAVNILLEQGRESLTHRAVAAQAQVSVGSTTGYFSSIDDLRDQALAAIAAEIDATIAAIAEQVDERGFTAEFLAGLLSGFLQDRRQVRASVALLSAAATDPEVRDLARRWSDRLAELVEQHLPSTHASALCLFIDGATAHAAVHDQPIARDQLRAGLALFLGEAVQTGEAAGAGEAVQTGEAAGAGETARTGEAAGAGAATGAGKPA